MKSITLSPEEVVFLKTMIEMCKVSLESKRFLLFNQGNNWDPKKRKKQLKNEKINDEIINNILRKL